LKKPLHGKKERFLIWSKGELIGWGVDDVKNLIQNANRAKIENLRSRKRLNVRDLEAALTCDWLELFLEKGITNEVVRCLNSRLTHVRFMHVLEPPIDGRPSWRRIAKGDEIDHPEISVAYGVANLLAIGAFDSLKSCRLKTCQKFFIGRPDAKWCSKACGSKHRVTQKRRRDKN
tara:strand:+ start:616 stop:1140 length:525 start_codon:yes stop_codon:yes gene_type:complete